MNVCACDVCQSLSLKIEEKCRKCGVKFGKYVCIDCRLFDDDDSKKQFHCDKCGICRVGGKDNFFHCDTCGYCMNNSIKDSHKVCLFAVAFLYLFPISISLLVRVCVCVCFSILLRCTILLTPQAYQLLVVKISNYCLYFRYTYAFNIYKLINHWKILSGRNQNHSHCVRLRSHPLGLMWSLESAFSHFTYS